MSRAYIVRDLRERGWNLTIEQQRASSVTPSLLLAAADALEADATENATLRARLREVEAENAAIRAGAIASADNALAAQVQSWQDRALTAERARDEATRRAEAAERVARAAVRWKYPKTETYAGTTTLGEEVDTWVHHHRAPTALDPKGEP